MSQVTAQAGATQMLPAYPPLPLLPDLEALMLAALRGAGMILFRITATPQPSGQEVSIQHRSSTGDQKGKKV